MFDFGSNVGIIQSITSTICLAQLVETPSSNRMDPGSNPGENTDLKTCHMISTPFASPPFISRTSLLPPPFEPVFNTGFEGSERGVSPEIDKGGESGRGGGGGKPGGEETPPKR